MRLVLAIFTTWLMIGCVADGSRSVVKEDVLAGDAEQPTWVFSLPACLPNCTEQDKTELTERGRIENLIVGAIDSATEEISFSMYTFSRKPIYRALVRAAARGVKVRGIVDNGQFRNLGSQCDSFEGCTLPAPYNTEEYAGLPIDERDAFLGDNELFRAATNTEKLVLLSPGFPLDIRPAPGSRRLVHNKFVVIDRKLLVNGSGNWSSTAVSINMENLGRHDRESYPEVVDSFVCAFDVLWQGDANLFQRDLRRCESDFIRFAPSPSRGANPVALVLDRINASQSTIDVAMHHLTRRDIFAALGSALQRGVRVRMLFDDDDCNARADEQVETLIAAGALVRYMPSNCKLFQLSHNKFGIFDGREVVNGSGNWSNAGMTRNYENFVRFVSDRDVSPFKTWYDQAWNMAVQKSACGCAAEDVACRDLYCVGQSPF